LRKKNIETYQLFWSTGHLLQSPQNMGLFQPIKPFHILAPIVNLIPFDQVRMSIDHIL
jgi:hypothetical protein